MEDENFSTKMFVYRTSFKTKPFAIQQFDLKFM